MSQKTEQFIDNLTANGKVSFTVDEFCQETQSTHGATLVAINRLKHQHKIASPSKGYYLVLTPEFRRHDCLPADFFIDNLMRHLNRKYYVSLLSAALYHGAAHQQPQIFQVMTPDKKKPIHCGQTHIEFIKNSNCNKTPTTKLKTRTGYMTISTPEGTAMDLLKYMRQSGGINRLATVIEELAESMNANALTQLGSNNQGLPWVNRLGYLLDKFEFYELSSALYDTFNKNSRITALVPYSPITGANRDKKWRVAINAKIESDLDDTY